MWKMKQIKILMKKFDMKTNEQGVVENNVANFFAEKHLAKPTSKPQKKR
jgi:hypothetical protein